MEDETPALERAGAGGGVALVVEVDVIVPIHNASRTLRDALHSAFHQRVVRLRPPSSASIDDHSPSSIDDDDKNNNNNEQEEGGSKKSRDTGVPLVLEVVVHVCCYDDGSTDDSWEILLQIAKEYTQKKRGEHAACSKIASGRTAEEDGQGRCRDQTGQCLCETKEEAPAAAISSSTLPHAPGTMLVRSCAVRGKRNGKSNNHVGCTYYAETHLHIAQSPDGVSRGAGYARNRAVEMRPAMGSLGNHKEQDRPKHNDCGNACDDKDEPNATYPPHHQFLCLLDSDDIMSENRVLVQVHYLLSLSSAERNRCLLGCNFSRDPPDSTARYTQWANSLSDDRLGLERYREVTVLQPTWVRINII
jgi:glycosyltransferase involved in cell wall biosynthesis